jgi:Fic family protein
MGEFAAWLNGAPDTPETAFGAHRRLVNIQPFNDGNGRTARLLMNLVLIRGGYPPVAVRPEDRPSYIAALQQQADDHGKNFTQLMYKRLDAILNDYLGALRESLPASGNPAPPGR